MVKHARLRRRTEHRLVAGVAGGVADRLNASVGFVRVFLAIASIWALPWVLGIYAVAALLIPPRGSDRPDWDNLVGLMRLGLIVGAPTLVAGAEVTLGEPFHGPLGWWIAYYGLVVAGGAALLSADYRRGRPRTREETRSVVLAAVPVGISVLALAATMLLAPDVRWERFVPAVAVVGAASAMLAARRGSTGLFVAPAVLALGVAGALVASDARLEGGLGAKHVTPEATASEPIVARRAIGNLTIDLRRVARGGRDATVDASVGVGTLRITLPPRMRVELDAQVGKGGVETFAFRGVEVLQGFDQRIRRAGEPERSGSGLPTIRVRAHVGLGQIDVSSGGSLVEVRS